MNLDYWHEDTLRLDKRLAQLRDERNAAELEAEHARSLHADMGGPIAAAEAEVQHLLSAISHVERLIERVKAGFPYLERHEFEVAVDACGQVSSWVLLSEVLTEKTEEAGTYATNATAPGIFLGHDDAVVRLPIEVQKRYDQAVSSRLFEKFEVCMCFEPPDESDEIPENTTYYLFGTILPPDNHSDHGDIFFIATWAAAT
ncbi:MAG TPA: hypothetical protein VM182_02660 [Terriglobia bacterium]|nr:hypothetical protein [Terriglobia bacterium]